MGRSMRRRIAWRVNLDNEIFADRLHPEGVCRTWGKRYLQMSVRLVRSDHGGMLSDALCFHGLDVGVIFRRQALLLTWIEAQCLFHTEAFCILAFWADVFLKRYSISDPRFRNL